MTKNKLFFFMLVLCAALVTPFMHAGKKQGQQELQQHLQEASVNTTRTDSKWCEQITHAAVRAPGNVRKKHKPHSEKRKQDRSYSTTGHHFPFPN